MRGRGLPAWGREIESLTVVQAELRGVRALDRHRLALPHPGCEGEGVLVHLGDAQLPLLPRGPLPLRLCPGEQLRDERRAGFARVGRARGQFLWWRLIQLETVFFADHR